MSRRRPDLALRPSVLDRILGSRGPAGGGVDPKGSVAATRAAVLRDLEWLLNTRCIHTGAGDGRPELERSVYTYGIPDPSSLDRGSVNMAVELARDIADTVRLFEPRLSQVRVALAEGEDDNVQALRYVVQAVLDVDPEPVPVTFDTRFDVGSGNFDVETHRGG